MFEIEEGVSHQPPGREGGDRVGEGGNEGEREEGTKGVELDLPKR